MTNKKETKLTKSTKIVATAQATQWCYVNTENEFEFLGQTFTISDDVKEYVVRNKAGEVDDFTNEAYMEEVLVVLDENCALKFYNQDYDEIEQAFVRVRA
jgi:hypothetical protein